MNIPVSLPGIEGQNLALCSAGMFNGAKLMLNGQPVTKQKNGMFYVRSNAGPTLAIKFKNRFLDPIPDLEVGGQTMTLVPPLQWYQYAWMAIPLVLIFMGGAIGGFCGGLAAGISSRVFRSDMSEGMKYGASALISAGAFVTYFVMAAAVLGALHK